MGGLGFWFSGPGVEVDGHPEADDSDPPRPQLTGKHFDTDAGSISVDQARPISVTELGLTSKSSKRSRDRSFPDEVSYPRARMDPTRRKLSSCGRGL